MAQPGHMYPDLVGPSCKDLPSGQSCILQELLYLIAGICWFSFRRHLHFQFFSRHFAYRFPDPSLWFFQMSLGQPYIFFPENAFCFLLSQPGSCCLILCQDHHTGSILIQPSDDPHRTGFSSFFKETCRQISQRIQIMSPPRMTGHTCRLIHRQDIRILIEDLQFSLLWKDFSCVF